MMVQAPARRLSAPELLLYSAVVAYIIFEFTRGTYIASREFDPGHRHSGVFLAHYIPIYQQDSYSMKHFQDVCVLSRTCLVLAVLQSRNELALSSSQTGVRAYKAISIRHVETYDCSQVPASTGDACSGPGYNQSCLNLCV